jgi:hypothetical protein
LKELTAQYFLPKIKSFNFNSILFRTDNTIAMLNINSEPFPNWNNEEECIVIFGDFISWFSSNNKLSELNIASSAISKFPKLSITKLLAFISLKKGFNESLKTS